MRNSTCKSRPGLLSVLWDILGDLRGFYDKTFNWCSISLHPLGISCGFKMLAETLPCLTALINSECSPKPALCPYDHCMVLIFRVKEKPEMIFKALATAKRTAHCGEKNKQLSRPRKKYCTQNQETGSFHPSPITKKLLWTSRQAMSRSDHL